MPIPDFQSIMLPFLEVIADGKEYESRDLYVSLAQRYQLTIEELEELLPSGKQKVFTNRIAWVKAHLLKAGLVERVRYGCFRITQRGKDVLAERPSKINLAFLKRFPEYVSFREGKNTKDEQSVVLPEKRTTLQEYETPDELLAETYTMLRRNLAVEVLERVRAMTPSGFERLVVELLVRMGYGGSFKDAGRTTRLSNDEGIDGVIKEDKLGLDSIYLQAKRWKEGNVIGRPEIQKFVGALAGQGAKKGVFITTSSFTREARDYKPMNDTKIVLIDGDELAELMIDNNLGVSVHYSYEIKRMDNDYFDEM